MTYPDACKEACEAADPAGVRLRYADALGGHSVNAVRIIGSVLSDNDGMPKKYQNPALEVRRDCARPYYFIRVSVPRPTPKGFKKRRERQHIGFLDEMTKKQAMKDRAQILEAVNSHRLVLQSQIYFSEIVSRFQESRLPQFGAGTAARYESQIKNHLLPVFGAKKLCDIDKQMVEAWLVSKDKEGLSWWTREGLRGVMSSIFSAAVDWKLWSGDNPASGIRLGRKKEVREKRLLTAEQLQQILANVSDDTRLMILIALVAGLRISEICGLKWEDIDLNSNTLTVRRRWYRGDLDEPKTEASKRVRQIGQLSGEFRRKYRSGASQHQFIFLSDDGQSPNDERDVLRFELRPLLKRLKLYYPGFGWHAFRRQNVTWRQTVGGATPFEAQKGAGHTKLDMTMLYSLNDEVREREQVDAIMDKLTGIAGGMKQ